jgi:hypothetical protein
MSNPQTSPNRYGVGTEETPTPRISNPENLARRIGATPGLYSQASLPVDVPQPTQSTDPHDITLIPDPSPSGDAENWAKAGMTGIRINGIGDNIIVSSDKQPILL